ncbi:MAG: DinB family protein [Anaerolineae bacterium]|jgi:hypothetical protein|nr:DinB family protein [Anaerolineae bacterium]
MNRIQRWIRWLILESGVRGKTPMQVAQRLERSRNQVLERIRSSSRNDENHKVITHIIGIEKWGQQRLRCALGEPLVQEEYNRYRPALSTPWDELAPLFEQTRAETLAIVRQIDPSRAKQMIPHNAHGEISVNAWIHYLNLHANIESRRLKK